VSEPIQAAFCPGCGLLARVIGFSDYDGSPLVHCDACMTPLPEPERSDPAARVEGCDACCE
jgi:hypothetical protein